MKKKIISIALLFLILQSCVSSKRFSQTVIVPSTGLKNQKMTGQCWSFASTSFLEAEAMRLGYKIPELSSFFFVYYKYLDQSKNYLEDSGKSYIKFGDLTFSVLEILKNYGAVPESVYDGKLGNIKSTKEAAKRMKEENEMNDLIKSKLDSLIKSHSDIQKSMFTIETILNNYIGKATDTFLYRNEMFSPKTFAKKYLPLNRNDYIELTSYSQHPFYKNVMLEIPANWRHEMYLNLPIEDFINTIDNAINSGFTLTWDGDIGEDGGFKDNGYVKVKGEYKNENNINQEQRQSAYDRKTTTDDHNMHLVGITHDRDGKKFYILKNTWGENRGMKGRWYLSENYFRLRTISVTVNKDGIPKSVWAKL